MYRMQVKTHFDAAHYIKDYVGKCQRMHGHRWDTEIAIEGEELDSQNILIDFSVVKKHLQSLLDAFLDHYVLNQTLDEENLTAEFLAKWIYDYFKPWVEADNKYRLARVCVWESPDCCIKYSPTMHATGGA